MLNNKIKICVKGSRRTGIDFRRETDYLVSLADCVEIDFNYPHDHNFSKELAYLKKLRLKHHLNFTIHAQYLSGSLNDFNERIRQETIKEIMRSIDQAEQLGAKVMTLHPALEPYGLKSERQKELELDSYCCINTYAKKKGIKIGLENEAQTCFWFPNRACRFELLIEIIKKVNSKNFGLTLDIGHANVTGEDYLEAIKKYYSFIFHIHAHDNLGRSENNLAKYNRPDPHLTPGRGNINWKAVIRLLTKIKYSGYLELECEPHDLEVGIKYLRSL